LTFRKAAFSLAVSNLFRNLEVKVFAGDDAATVRFGSLLADAVRGRGLLEKFPALGDDQGGRSITRSASNPKQWLTKTQFCP
jgi:hypothetical protein